MFGKRYLQEIGETMSKFAQRIVLAAALLFLGEKIVAIFGRILLGAVRRQLSALIELRKKSEEETSSSFELWWEQGPKQQAKEAMFKRFAPPGTSPEAFGLLYGSSSTDKFLEPVYNSAKSLAAYAYGQHEERILLSKLSAFGKRELDNLERRVDLLRSELLDSGLDPRVIEEYFAQPVE